MSAELKDDGVVLMFSGGRDSTIAAVRLAREHFPLTLVTVSSDHLFGIDAVKRRLVELDGYLPSDTAWKRIRQPRSGAMFGAAFSQTCLPCQHDYALAGAMIAKQLGAARLAMGYAEYQSSWPEQSVIATNALSLELERVGITLDLPVYALASKEQAQSELIGLGLSEVALEQKCSKQVSNIILDGKDLVSHVAHWADELRLSLARSNQEVEVIEEGSLGCLAALA